MEKSIKIKLKTFCYYQMGIVTLVVSLGLLSYLVIYFTGHKQLLGFARFLDVGSEQSLPTYISTVNLLLVSILLFFIYIYEKEMNNPGKSYWKYLSFVFIFLSVDEAGGIHEIFSRINAVLARSGFMPDFPLLGNHQWVVFGVIFVIIGFIYIVPFLRKLPDKTRFYFVGAGLIYIIGALGFEFLGAVMLKTGLVDSNKDLLYLIRRIFEEGFEMYGIALFNCALYREILNRKMVLQVRSD